MTARALVALALALVAPIGLAEAGASAQPHGRLVAMSTFGGLPPPGDPTSETLTVSTTGACALTYSGAPARTARRFRIAPTMLSTLKQDLRKTRFATLKRVYTGRAIDYPVVQVTYGGRSVELRDGATGPRRLRPAVALLQRIVRQHSGP